MPGDRTGVGSAEADRPFFCSSLVRRSCGAARMLVMLVDSRRRTSRTATAICVASAFCVKVSRQCRPGVTKPDTNRPLRLTCASKLFARYARVFTDRPAPPLPASSWMARKCQPRKSKVPSWPRSVPNRCFGHRPGLTGLLDLEARRWAYRRKPRNILT